MTSKKTIRNIVKLSLAALFMASAVIPASAHNSVLYASKNTADVGETVEILASLSEPLGIPNLPFYKNSDIDFDTGVLKLAVFSDGKGTDLAVTAFTVKNGEGKTIPYEDVTKTFNDVKKSNPELDKFAVMERVSDGNVSSFKIISGKTTTIADAAVFGNAKAFAKTFVNLKPDGESKIPRAGYFSFDGLELCPIDDLGSVKPGGKVRVQALIGGAPQKGVVVYAGYKGLDESKWLNVLEYSGGSQPAMHAGVTDTTGVVELPLPQIPNGTTELKDVYIFTDGDLVTDGTVRYRSSINFTLTN